MKRLLYLLLPTLVLGGCKKFLDKKPDDFIQPAAFYQNETQLLQALYGIYAPLADDPTGSGGAMYGEFLGVTAQVPGDELVANGTNPDPRVHVAFGQQDATNLKIAAFWQFCYAGIERANNMLAADVDTTKTAGSDVRALMAEAKFMRGYYYFLIAQRFGGAILRLDPASYPTPFNVPRASLADTYKQIMKDMTEAEPYLYPINSPKMNGAAVRVSQTTADGILARVCLFMAGAAPVGLGDNSQYANAKMWAEKVINSGKHNLTVQADTIPNLKNIIGLPLGWDATNGNPAYSNNGYAQVWVAQAQGKPNIKETMWEVMFNYTSAANFKMNYVGSQLGISGGHALTTGTGGGIYQANQWLYDSYKPGDLRRDWNISPYSFLTTGTAPNVTTKRNFVFNGNPAPAIQVLTRFIGKWRREYEPYPAAGLTKQGGQTTISFPILRYSDVLLMLAEAEFMTNGSTQTALDAINQVRRRAYGLDINTPNDVCDFTTITLADIQDERSRELCFEGLRPTDLIRWGIFTQRCQDVINYINTNGFPTDKRAAAVFPLQNYVNGGAKMLLWPIPTNETNINKAVVQNLGW